MWYNVRVYSATKKIIDFYPFSNITWVWIQIYFLFTISCFWYCYENAAPVAY